MNDPYKVLDVSPNDSDEKIKSAYKQLVKKYHPDNYAQSPLSDLAQEKMAEVNAAYDEIMNMRRGGQSSSNDSYSNNNSYGGYSQYPQIRSLIQSGNVTSAEQMLDAVDINLRNAEWYFLKGSVCYARGWLNDAYSNFQNAVNLDPSNMEYQSALRQMANNRGGFMNGNPNPNYRTSPNAQGCSGCDMCSSLICADCCCECMGGDLISCC